MLNFEIIINNGNEYLNIEDKTITVNEKVQPASQIFLAEQINLHNRLVPTEIAEQCLMTFCDVASNLMAQGFSIHLRNKKDDVLLRLYPDVKIDTSNGNINMAKAQELMPGIEDITVRNARELVSRAGVVAKVGVEIKNKFTEKFNKEDFELNCVGVVERDRVVRKDSSTGQTVIDSSTGTDNNGGSDLPPGNG